MNHRKVFDFSFFSGGLEICPESNIPLTKLVAPLPKHPMYSLFLPSGVMSRVYITLHLPIAFDDITRQLANCNNYYKFSACLYSVLQEFTIAVK